MALVIGTNIGFLETAPTTDPEGSATFTCDGVGFALKDTLPATATTITEIGMYVNNSETNGQNWEVGMYDDNVGSPDAVIGSLNQTNTLSSGIGWKVVTGLNINVSAEQSNAVWIAFQIDNGTTIQMDRTGGGVGNTAVDV